MQGLTVVAAAVEVSGCSPLEFVMCLSGKRVPECVVVNETQTGQHTLYEEMHFVLYICCLLIPEKRQIAFELTARCPLQMP